MSAPPLTGVLAEIAAAIGEDRARAIAEQMGGQYLKLSARPRATSPLARVVGLAAAIALHEALGPVEIVVPCGAYRGAGGRARRIREMLAEGVSHARIAAAVDVHVRTVHRHASGLRRDPAQPDLFD